jgi:hypothetical protein
MPENKQKCVLTGIMTPKSSFSTCCLSFVDFKGVLKLVLRVAALELVELRYGAVADTVNTELDVLEPWMGCACSVVEPERTLVQQHGVRPCAKY